MARVKCPNCERGFLAPVYGRSGRECTVEACGFRTHPGADPVSEPTHVDIRDTGAPYVRPTCGVDGCTRGADFVEHWGRDGQHVVNVCARHHALES